jgi:dolichol-phosphate mannosyltransferase
MEGYDASITQPRTLVIVPTYNERPNLERLLRGIRAGRCEALVVDDGSPDGTGDLAGALARVDPGIHVLQRGRKLGLGTAYIAGLRAGVERDFDLLVTMDADGSHRPDDLQRVLAAARSGSALVVGSRYVPGGAIAGWTLRRKLLSRVANLYAQRLLGLGVRDCTSGYRCYPRRVIESIDLESVVADGYAFLIEILHRCLRAGIPVVEVPIRFEDRLAGRSKVSGAEIVKAALLVPRLRWAGAPPKRPTPATAEPEVEVLGSAASPRSRPAVTSDDRP